MYSGKKAPKIALYNKGSWLCHFPRAVSHCVGGFAGEMALKFALYNRRSQLCHFSPSGFTGGT